ncbi:MAG: YihY/virulence factor BrkB family protein [Alphaproteobacteria bacterium]|nr:YihY/virulence factor BrkB family protein [Alphaproteobacteria bacterium]
MLAEFWAFVKAALAAFFHDGALSRGAAISFYAMTATPPILYICAWLAGLVLGHHAASSGLIQEVGRIVGADTAKMLQTAIHSSGPRGTGFWAGAVGTAILVFTAGGVFIEVQDALNAIWHAAPPRMTLWRFLRSWIESLAMVLGLGVLLAMSLMVNALISGLGEHAEHFLGVGSWAARTVNFGVSATFITVLFAAIYMVLPNRDLRWRDVLVGAVVTTVLIEIGEFLIGLYLATSSISQRYGTAGGTIAVLMWIYYSVQVFLLGAEFTKVWSMRHAGLPAQGPP